MWRPKVHQISRFIRFIDGHGRDCVGEPILPPGEFDSLKAKQARRIRGNWLKPISPSTDEIVDIASLLCPFSFHDLGSIRCIGLNYHAHAKELGQPIPERPVLFYKPPNAITGPSTPVWIPDIAQNEGLDYEAELVVVIGRKGKDIHPSLAHKFIGGYAVGNDISHRVWQFRGGGGQWGMGKSFDSWAPVGPAIVDPAVVPDPNRLKIWTKVNGNVVQSSSTADMIFSVSDLISFLSQGTTLGPGDLIFTGTPEGVALGKKPPIWLKHGDLVETGIEGIGTIENTIRFIGNRPTKKSSSSGADLQTSDDAAGGNGRESEEPSNTGLSPQMIRTRDSGKQQTEAR